MKVQLMKRLNVLPTLVRKMDGTHDAFLNQLTSDSLIAFIVEAVPNIHGVMSSLNTSGVLSRWQGL